MDATADSSRIAQPAEGRRSPRLQRFLKLFPKIHSGEGLAVGLFAAYAFLLLVCYYVLKTLREPLLLMHGSAESKSYAYAVIALVLLFVVPVYGALFRHTERRQILRWVTLFFLASLELFFFLGRSGIDVGFAYYVWVGVFSVTMPAQFWAQAADSFSVESGKRLFPVIMLGATFGALVGPQIVGSLFSVFGPWQLMLLPMVLLAVSLPLARWARKAVPGQPSDDSTMPADAEPHPLGGFALVFRHRYLCLFAVLVVLLNCVNTIGEYVLTELVLEYARGVVASDLTAEMGAIIAGFYGQFFFAVNALTVVLQMFVVSQVFRLIGVRGALLILPVIAIIGYGLVAFVPIFAVIRLVKVLENSVDYSIMNTARHALYLPLPPAQKYVGKTAIDTFFWRFGDVVQAGIIFVGLHWLDFDYRSFALLNMVLAALWLAVAVRLSRAFPLQSSERREATLPSPALQQATQGSGGQ